MSPWAQNRRTIHHQAFPTRPARVPGDADSTHTLGFTERRLTRQHTHTHRSSRIRRRLQVTWVGLTWIEPAGFLGNMPRQNLRLAPPWDPQHPTPPRLQLRISVHDDDIARFFDATQDAESGEVPPRHREGSTGRDARPTRCRYACMYGVTPS